MNASVTSIPGRRGSRRRKLLFIGGGLFVLLVTAYFVITSAAFFKGVILPRVSRSVGGEVTVADASIHPFSRVILRNLTIKTTGTEPLLRAEEVRLRYGLFAILRGRLKVDELAVVSPIVQIVENADGASNLDPLFKKQPKQAAKRARAPSKPPQVDLKNVAVKNATFRRVKLLRSGEREFAELTGVNIALNQLKNGQPGRLTIAARIKMTRPTNDVIEATSNGRVEFSLNTDLTPQTLKVNAEHEVLRAEGSLRELRGIRAVVTGDVVPGEVRELSERFLRGDKLLGQVKVTGPLDFSKKEARLKLEVASIDRQVLNLVGAPFGLDFGGTTLDSTTELSLTQGGSVVSVKTRFNAAKFSVSHHGRTTPPLDLQLACDVRVNTVEKSALMQSLTLEGKQNQRPFLRGNLTQPMRLAWGDETPSTGESAFELAVNDFNLDDWQVFLGDAISGGRLSLNLKLASEQGGKQLKLGITSRIADLAARLGSTPLTQVALALKLDSELTDFKKVKLTDYRLDLTRQAQPALTVSGSAGYDGAVFNLQTEVKASMAHLLGKGPTAALNANLMLDGRYTNQTLDLRQLRLAFAPTQRAPKNELTVTGQFDLSTPGVTRGHLTAKADTLDLTALYDAFAGEPRRASTAGPTTSRAASPDNAEPEPVTLPLQCRVEVNLAQVFLREIHVRNCQATAKLDGGRILLAPCRLMLNGAPVSASVDLDRGVKGYTYALGLQMDRVPLEPIANTFSPENRGKYQGIILANAQIKGAGVTGPSLQKSLGGQVAFTFTNAILQLIGPKSKVVMVPIATLLRIPQITKSPLNWLDARTELGGGKIQLRRFAVQSEAFEATTQGEIPIAEVLTNSPLNLPVEFALRRSLAEASSLLPPNTPPQAQYAVLPQFVTVKGTLGEPKPDLNKRALGGLLLKSGVGIAEKLGVKVGDKAGGVLQGVGNLLTGQQPATTNQPSTNPPARLNPLDLFRRK